MEGRVVSLTALAVLLLAAQVQAAPLFSQGFQGFNTITTLSIASGSAVGNCASGVGSATPSKASRTDSGDVGVSLVPEPVALLAMAVGLVSLGGVIKRSKQSSPVFLSFG